VILDGLPHAIFPFLGHEHLAQFPSLLSHQVETSVRLSPRAVAIRFATASAVTSRAKRVIVNLPPETPEAVILTGNL
jgi:hypothetical protein